VKTASDLGDVLVLEYTGAVPPADVRSAVREVDRSLPAMRNFSEARATLLEAAVRRRLVDRLVQSLVRDDGGHTH
jgi:hypothetical protein